MENMNEIIVLTTVDSAEIGRRIAAALVEGRLAACVSIVPGVRSVYRWQGKLCDDGELLLLIKTTLLSAGMPTGSMPKILHTAISMATQSVDARARSIFV